MLHMTLTNNTLQASTENLYYPSDSVAVSRGIYDVITVFKRTVKCVSGSWEKKASSNAPFGRIRYVINRILFGRKAETATVARASPSKSLPKSAPASGSDYLPTFRKELMVSSKYVNVSLDNIRISQENRMVWMCLSWTLLAGTEKGIGHDSTELHIVAVAQERHFGSGGELVSQPTLSIAIKKLEEELAVSLFDWAATILLRPRRGTCRCTGA